MASGASELQFLDKQGVVSSDEETISLSAIEDSVLEVLPKIGARKLAALIETLVDPNKVGVSCPSDLKYVVEEDIRHHLTTIEVRKLISSWKTKDMSSGPKKLKLSSKSTTESSSDSVSEQDSQESISSHSETPTSIPWHKMPEQLMESLRNKERPSPSLRKQMIRIIIDNFYKPGQPLPRTKVLRFIAYNVVAAFPDAFQDEVDGDVVGSGHESILRQLINRVDNVSRSNSQCFQKRKLSQEKDCSPKKKQASDSYGCVNWQPLLPKDETKETQKIKMEQMKNAYKSNKHNLDISCLMEETYASLRQAINSSDCALEDIMEDWPYLFEEKYMLDHFNTLAGVNVMDKFQLSANKKVPILISFMKMQAQSMQRLRENVKHLSEAITKKGDNMPSVMGALLLLCSYLQEDIEVIVLSTEKLEKDQSINDMDCPGTPCIIAEGPPLEATHFHVSVGKVVLMKVLNPLTAMAVWFSSFFIFNLEYPFKAAATCEFLQRCFVGINPQQGSKTSTHGKKSGVNPNVLRLTNKLKDFQFQNDWNV